MPANPWNSTDYDLASSPRLLWREQLGTVNLPIQRIRWHGQLPTENRVHYAVVWVSCYPANIVRMSGANILARPA